VSGIWLINGFMVELPLTMPQKQDCKTTYSTINMTQEEAKS